MRTGGWEFSRLAVANHDPFSQGRLVQPLFGLFSRPLFFSPDIKQRQTRYICVGPLQSSVPPHVATHRSSNLCPIVQHLHFGDLGHRLHRTRIPHPALSHPETRCIFHIRRFKYEQLHLILYLGPILVNFVPIRAARSSLSSCIRTDDRRLVHLACDSGLITDWTNLQLVGQRRSGPLIFQQWRWNQVSWPWCKSR